MIAKDIKGLVGINIDSLKFKKMSKKMKDNLNQNYDVDLKISQINEIIAESLGFRNLYELQECLKKSEMTPNNNIHNVNNIAKIEGNIFNNINEIDYKNNRLDELLNNASLESLTSLFTLFLNDKGDLWDFKANELIVAIMNLVIDLKEKGERVTLNQIEHLLDLNVIVKHIKENQFEVKDLKNYCNSLPSYDPQSEEISKTALEQHNFVIMYLNPIFTYLRKIEKLDVIILQTNWFSRIEIFQSLKVNHKEAKIIFLKCIEKDVRYQDSWLEMEEFKYFVVQTIKPNVKEYYMTDLLALTMNTINPRKIVELKNLIEGLLKKYSEVKVISDSFTFLQMRESRQYSETYV